MRYEWRGSGPIAPGTWCCPDHGPVEPDPTTVVPSCPADDGGVRCRRAVMLAELDRRGKVGFLRPSPKTCPDGHDLAGLSTARLTHQPCICGGHTVWLCNACGKEREWPPPCT